MQSIGFQDVLQTSDTAQATLGSNYQTPDGRVWVYVKASEAVAKGNVVVPVASVGVDTVSSSANSAGEIVFITEGSAGWTVGQFIDAWVLVDDGTGAGQVAKVRRNTVDTLELYPEWALDTALAVGDSDITIYRTGLVEKSAITDKTQRATGGAQVAFASDDYGWVLARGVGVVIAGEALTEGSSVVAGDDTEGQVLKGTTAKGDFDEQTVGVCLAANASADDGALLLFTLISA